MPLQTLPKNNMPLQPPWLPLLLSTPNHFNQTNHGVHFDTPLDNPQENCQYQVWPSGLPEAACPSGGGLAPPPMAGTAINLQLSTQLQRTTLSSGSIPRVAAGASHSSNRMPIFSSETSN